MTKEVDRPAIRTAGDEFFGVGGDMWRTAGSFDEEPVFLRARDWGYQGEGSDPDSSYEALRAKVRDFLRDGADAFGELRTVLHSVAARSEQAEETSAAELLRIGRRLNE
ncbi:hypothetical protein [Flindersiella endophytica]